MSDHIILKVDHNSTYIEGCLSAKIYQSLKKHLGFRPENAEWMIRKNSQNKNKRWMKDWDGIVTNLCRNKRWCKCFIKKDGTHFSSGLLSNVVEFFGDENIPYELVDIRNKSEQNIDLSMSGDFEIRDYQTDVIQKAVKAQRGIIKAATGSGKCPISAGIIAEVGRVPFVFYVPSKDLLFQTQSEFEKFLRHNGCNLKVGAIGAGKKEIADVNVMTMQTAVRALGGKYKKFDDEDEFDDKTDIEDIKQDIKDLISSAKGIAFDECQHCASETAQIISDASISAQYRFGMSATPTRDLGDDLLIDACFGKCIANISASFLIKRGYLVKPEIFFVPVKNMKGMPKSSYQNIYKDAIVENPVRNDYIAKIAKGMQNDGRIVLILCKHISHGDMLNTLIPGSVFLHGSHSGKERKGHLDKMRKREASITLATSIWDEGIDVRPLDTLILAGSGKSSTRALQRVGRTLRPYPGKKDSIVIDFEDHCKYMLSHSRKRRKIYQTEPEFEIKTLEID
tara:strand:- start:711 stop:2237 length:1527 start_codon:yes stop_codon:yes gene_type:complete